MPTYCDPSFFLIKKKGKGSKHPKLVVHVTNKFFQLLIKNNNLQVQTIMHNHKCKVLTKVRMCKDDEVQGISKDPILLTLFQNIANDNGGQNFGYCSTSCLGPWRRYAIL